MTNLSKLLKELDQLFRKRELEKRVNGITDYYKDLHRQYLVCLTKVAKETEKEDPFK